MTALQACLGDTTPVGSELLCVEAGSWLPLRLAQATVSSPVKSSAATTPGTR